MKLKEYLDSECIKYTKFADRIGIDRFKMSRMLKPGYCPTIDIVDIIETATYKNVRYKDWLDGIKEHPPQIDQKENIA